MRVRPRGGEGGGGGRVAGEGRWMFALGMDEVQDEGAHGVAVATQHIKGPHNRFFPSSIRTRALRALCAPSFKKTIHINYIFCQLESRVREFLFPLRDFIFLS